MENVENRRSGEEEEREQGEDDGDCEMVTEET